MLQTTTYSLLLPFLFLHWKKCITRALAVAHWQGCQQPSPSLSLRNVNRKITKLQRSPRSLFISTRKQYAANMGGIFFFFVRVHRGDYRISVHADWIELSSSGSDYWRVFLNTIQSMHTRSMLRECPYGLYLEAPIRLESTRKWFWASHPQHRGNAWGLHCWAPSGRVPQIITKPCWHIVAFTFKVRWQGVLVMDVFW